MKKILLISLFVFFTACTNVTPVPTIQPFTETVAVATLNPATETPTATETAVSETAQEAALGKGIEAGLRGESANDYTTWTDPYFRGIAENPNVATDTQLMEEADYVTGLREGDFLKFLAENPQQAQDILMKFVSAQFKIDGMILVNATYKAETAVDFVKKLTPEQRLYLEIVRRAASGEAIYRTPAEKMMNKINHPHDIKYNEKLTEGQVTSVYGVHIPAGRSDLTSETFPITMFGRSSFLGKQLLGNGSWQTADYIMMDLVGLDNTSNTLLGLMKDTINGAMQLVDIVIVPKGSAPILFDSSTIYSIGGWSPDEFAGAPPVVSFTTNSGRAGYESFSSDVSQITMGDVLSNLSWTTGPNRIKINVPNEHATDEEGKIMIQSIFIDPLTGLNVLGYSGGEYGEFSGVFFYPDNGYRNEWP